jgi:hypothetical protein
MGYLCMKILALHGVITVHRKSKVRNIEKAIYKSYRNINSIDSMQEEGHNHQICQKGKWTWQTRRKQSASP